MSWPTRPQLLKQARALAAQRGARISRMLAEAEEEGVLMRGPSNGAARRLLAPTCESAPVRARLALHARALQYSDPHPHPASGCRSQRH